MSLKDLVIDLQRSIETGDASATACINADRYTQHNLNVGDGLAPILALHDLLPAETTRARPLRALQDGPYVAVHVDYDLWGPKAGVDIHRFENGLIVEHWDNLQDAPSRPNPAGRTMFDGPVDVGDPARTGASKSLVRDFIADAAIGRRADSADRYFGDGRLLQHSPFLDDGAKPFLSYLGSSGAGGRAEYLRMHMLIGEGDFVLSVCEGNLDGAHSAFYDLFRVGGGVIAEHWDVVEAIPPRSEWKNVNGKF